MSSRGDHESRSRKFQSESSVQGAVSAQHLLMNDEAYRQIQERISQNIKIEKQVKSYNVSCNILTCLRNHFIFYNLSEDELQNITNKMFYAQVAQGQYIYRPKDYGTCFFFIETGAVDVSGSSVKNKIFKPNQGFGELALLYNTQRNSTAKALEPCNLWAIDRVTFRQAVEEIIIRQYTQNKKIFQSVRFFSNLSSEQKDIVASSLIKQRYSKGQNIINEGDPGSSFYFIKQGSASVYKSSKFQKKLLKGDSFGQQSLYYNTMRLYTIKADQDTVCLLLSRDTLHRVMGDNIYDVTFKNFIRWAFEKNPTITQFTKTSQEKILEEMTITSYKAQESVLKRGVSGFQKLVVVIEGTLKKLRSGNIVATKGQCYGQEFLREDGKILDDQIVMQNYGVIAQITSTAFYDAVGRKNLQGLIQQKIQEKDSVLERLQTPNTVAVMLKSANLADIRINCSLGKTKFGQRYSVSYKGQQFSLKITGKTNLKVLEVEQFAINEASVMSQISCEFVSMLGRKLQSSNYLYYISENVKGVDLYECLKNIGLLSTEDSQFYTATIIIILEYFHEKGIICRDIKPENFMVDSQGYLKLVNLPAAKRLQKDTLGNLKKTVTVIGTPHYMAPDIVIGKGYNNMVDLWSLGVCLYEFLCGYLPFGDSAQGAYEIYESIMQSQLKFPAFLHDKKAKKLIGLLLSHNPNQRHGGSFDKLKKNPWFDSFEWKGLYEKNRSVLNPPYIPEVRDRYADSRNITFPDLVKEFEKGNSSKPRDDRWRTFDMVVQ